MMNVTRTGQQLRGLFNHPGRRMAAMLVLFLLLAVAAGLWSLSHSRRLTPPERPLERAERQVARFGGAGVELRYAESGLRRSVCGYIGRSKSGPAVAFVSTPTRILFSDDPLPTEFAELRGRHCPAFLTRPPSPGRQAAASS